HPLQRDRRLGAGDVPGGVMDLFGTPVWSEERRRGVTLGAQAALLVFSTAMIWTATGERTRLPWYDPLSHRWILSAAAPGVLAMDYYGRVGLSLLAGIAGGIAAGIAAARRRPPGWLSRALPVWALGVTLVGVFLYAYTIGTRVIEPPPPGTI